MLSLDASRWGPNVPEKAKPSQAWAFRPWAAVCAPVVVLSVLISVRHTRRGYTLVPLLDAITSSRVCFDSAAGTCAVELRPEAATRFDLHELENPLLGFIYAQVINKDRSEMAQILQGAHVRVTDPDASFYGFFKHQPGVWTRISSHQSDRQQFAIPEGRVMSSVLVGTLHNSTWFQLEASPWDPVRNPRGSLGHVLDFLEYHATGRNVGPLGTSSSTDRDPLVKDTIQRPQDVCPERCQTPISPVAAIQVVPPALGRRLVRKPHFMLAAADGPPEAA